MTRQLLSLLGSFLIAAQPLLALPVRAQEAGAGVATTPAQPVAPAEPAAEQPAAADIPAEKPREQLVMEGTLTPITLKEAVKSALEQSEEIQLVEIDYRKSIESAREQLGTFNPNLSASYTYTNADAISPNAFNAANPIVKTKTHNFSLGVNGLIPTGATYDISLVNERVLNSSPFNTLAPQYNAKLQGVLKQPLLKNAGLGVTLTQLRVARATEESKKAEYLQRTNQTVFSVIQAYWELFFREKDLEAKQDSLKAAEDLVRVSENRVRVKVDPPINLTQARAGAETRRGEVITAREQLEIARDNLRRLLSTVDPDKDLTASVLLHPADAPSFEPFDPPYRASVTTALDTRPEFTSARLAKENAERLASAAWNGRLPELNANLTGGMAGLSGEDNPAAAGSPPSQFQGGLGTAYDTMFNLDGPYFSLGAEFKMPIPNHKNRAAYARAKLDEENADIAIRQLEEKVYIEVRTAIRSLQTGLQRIKSTELNVQLAQENVNAEKRRYEVGLSTSWDLLEREKELTAAKANHYRALADYNNARASYELATGKILDYVGIDVAEDPS